MKYLLAIISLIAIAVVGMTPARYDSLLSNNRVSLGSTNFPTSLDSLTNPAATDSVATVSHSSQHANANDAIEALEAKLGVTSSTAVNNSVLIGNGSGSSIWTTYATTSSMSAISASTTNLTAFGSTTLQNFTAKQATTTQATTTNFAISSLNNQIPYANSTGGILPVTIGTNLSFTSGTLSASLTADYKAATSSMPYIPGANPYTATIKAATTTSITQGESMMIWGKLKGSAAQSYILAVKSAGQGTTTLDWATAATGDGAIPLMGLYNASTSNAAGNIEIYIGDANKNYIELPQVGFMYIRFTP